MAHETIVPYEDDFVLLSVLDTKDDHKRNKIATNVLYVSHFLSLRIELT